MAHYHKDSFHAGYPLHKHDYFEVLFFISGHVDYEVNNRVYSLQHHDILIIHPQHLHQPHILTSKEDYERIVLWISKSYLQQLCEEDADVAKCIIKNHPENEPCLVRPQSELQTNLRDLFFDLTKPSIYEKSGQLSKKKIRHLIRVISTLPKPREYRLQVDNPDQLLIKKILQYLDEHFNENLSLDAIASRFFINKFHFVHQFTDRVGISPYRYIMQKRLNHAADLLLQGHKTKEIALICGFKDYANFYRAFKSSFKKSPSEYKKEQKSDLV